MEWFKQKIIDITIAALTTILVFGVHIAHIEARNVHVAVIISSKGPPFDETLEGFQKYLQRQGISTDYDLYPLEGDHEKAVPILQKIKKNAPALIFTLGSLATEITLKEIVDTPVIAGMILRPDLFQKTSNGTGVFLEFPAETQFKWLQHFLPNTKRAGVIYDPRENQERIENADRIAKKMGLKLETKAVQAPQDLPNALNNLSKNIDVLWGVADTIVLNAQTAKYILLFSFKNYIPFIGLSSAWVKAGALYSLESDYTDTGMQCGEIAVRVLQGTKVSSIPPAPPRKVIYVLNLNTAGHMKIKISEKLIREAHLTY